MSTCYYHPQAKSKFMCPDCGEDVCDRCRLEGGLQRCGHCATNGPPPGGPRIREPEPAAVGAAGEAGAYGGYDGGGDAPGDLHAMHQEVMCSNHPSTTADMQCLNCLQAYCMSCMADGTMCADCKLDPDGRAAPQEDYTPPPVVDVGYDGGNLDFAGGYAEQGFGEQGGYDQGGYGQGGYDQGFEQGGYDQGGYDQGYGDDFAGSYASDAAPAPPRPKKPAGAKKAGAGPAGKKGAPGKKGAAAKGKGKGGPPIAAIAGGVAALAIIGGAAWYFVMGPGKAVEFAGPTKVTINAPKNGATLKGLQYIDVKVASPEQVDRVEIHVDGKYWDKFKKAPFKSQWQTGVFKNGKHSVEAVVTYKSGQIVADKKTYFVKN